MVKPFPVYALKVSDYFQVQVRKGSVATPEVQVSSLCPVINNVFEIPIDTPYSIGITNTSGARCDVFCHYGADPSPIASVQLDSGPAVCWILGPTYERECRQFVSTGKSMFLIKFNPRRLGLTELKVVQVPFTKEGAGQLKDGDGTTVGDNVGPGPKTLIKSIPEDEIDPNKKRTVNIYLRPPQQTLN